MKKVDEELKEIEVFSLEQLEVLPQEAKDSIVILSRDLPSKELLVLNPLVAELIKIKKLESLVYTPLKEDATKEDIQKHKDNIQEFKDAKSQIVELKKKNAAAKKTIKGPLDALGSEVIKIEKSINDIAKDVLDVINKTFDSYLVAEANKKSAAAAAKLAKEQAALTELTETNKKNLDIIAKGKIITFLKYEILIDTKEEVVGAIENYSLENLLKLKQSLIAKTFGILSQGKDLTLLTEEELEGIKLGFQREVDQLVKNIETRVVALLAIKENESLNTHMNYMSGNAPANIPSYQTAPAPVQAPAPTPIPPNNDGNIMAHTDMYEAISHKGVYTLGENGASRGNKEAIYPKDDKNVDLLDLVIAELSNCKENILYIREQYKVSSNIVHTEEDQINMKRVLGAGALIDKTVLYVLGQLTKENK